MKRLNNILYLLLIGILLLPSCNNKINSEQLKEDIDNTFSEFKEYSTANNEEPQETAIVIVVNNSDIEAIEISDELRIDIDVYVNDELMDVIVYKNVNESHTSQPYNLGDFVLARPIMDLLDITYFVDEENDIITLTSDKYGSSYRPYSEYAIIIEDNLYIPFNFFNLHTNGSLKQEDSSAMYLYTCDYERTDIPATLEECYVMLDEELDAEDIEFIKNSTEEERINMHFGLGLWMRNNWLYPTQSKIAELIYDNGILHTDDMSALIIEGYYRYLNNEPCSLEELISWYMDN